MIGLYGAHAGGFALFFAAVSTLAFAGPFLLSPAGWGRAMQWTVPAERELMDYYARCLGCLALGANALAMWGALRAPELLAGYFIVLCPFAAMMVLLHVYGWLARRQPWTETAEIPMWAGVVLGCLLFWP